MSCRTGRCKKISLLLVPLAMAILATPAFAGNCLQEEYNLSTKQSLNCTANDVRVAKVINVRDPQTGLPITTCTPGSFSFLADYLVQTTATSSRSNIGLYFQTNPEATDALFGTCSDNIITANNSSHYDELDPQVDKHGNATPDNCGDSTSGDPTVCLSATNRVQTCTTAQKNNCTAANNCFPGTQIVSALISNFTCPGDLPNGTQLSLPNCTSWQIPGGTIQCNSNDGTYQSATFNGAPAAIPGSPSKCNCGTIPLGITVQAPGVVVQKACEPGTPSTPTFNPGNPNAVPPVPPAQSPTKCTFSTENGTVTYYVNITNESNFGSVVIDQLCDDQYGQIYVAGGVTPTCAKGVQCATGIGTGCVTSTTCSSANLGSISTSGQCTFTVTQHEANDITDTVTASGHGTTAGSFGPTSSNSVEVVTSEAPSTATITKGHDSTRAACATERYTVDIANTSGADENLKLTAISDSYFGDITTVHGTGDAAVVATTCAIPTGGASLPVGGSDYTCTFDGQFCHTFGQIVTTAGKCASGVCSAGLPNTTACSTDADCNVTCNGIQNTNKVSGTLVADEAADKVTVSNNTLTVNECFTFSSSSTTP